MAVDILNSRGVPENRILFLNLIASPEGVTGFAKRFPELRIVTAFVDQGLDEKKYVRFVIRLFLTELMVVQVTSSLDWETLVIAFTPSNLQPAIPGI